MQFRSTLLKMVEEWQNGDLLSRLEANHLAMTLLLSIFRQHGHASAVTARHSHSLNWVSSYLSFHVGEPLSVADMARRANLSPSRFAAVFRRHFGLSPHQYFLRLRRATTGSAPRAARPHLVFAPGIAA